MAVKRNSNEALPGGVNLATQRCRHASLGCFKVFIFAALMISVVYGLLILFTGAAVINAWFALEPYLVFWRLLWFLVLIGGWPVWVHRFGDWAQLPPLARQALINARWRFAGFLIVADLLMVQTWFDGSIPVTL